ncbi:hypothetical protein [Aliikangiella sp. IMCC44359]|uniref:hypothetical protein n=1 Tax=Aliikangiella sp. IMCC44359 TaxID=3459125 RepID=UPI00403B14BC
MPFIATKKNPSGPDLVNLEHHEVNLSGTTIRFDAPYHRDAVADYGCKDNRINLYNKSAMGRFSGNSLSQIKGLAVRKKNWSYTRTHLFNRFGRDLGLTRFFVRGIYLPDFSSLFRPRRFEAGVEAYIFDEYFSAVACRRDYQLLNFNGTNWAHFKEYKDKELDQVDYFYATPVTDEHLLMVSFDNTVYEDNTKVPQLHNELADLIMSSFQVELSEDAKAQQAEAQQNYPYEKLSTSLPALAFDYVSVEAEFECMVRLRGEHPEYDDLPYEEFQKIGQADLAAQGKKRDEFDAAIRQGIIDKFKQLEAEDYQRYMAEQKVTSK